MSTNKDVSHKGIKLKEKRLNLKEFTKHKKNLLSQKSVDEKQNTIESLDADLLAMESMEYYPDRNKTSNELLSEKELLDIEKYMLFTLDNTFSDKMNATSDIDIKKLTSHEVYNPEENKSSSSTLSIEEQQDIEEGLNL